MIRRVLATQAPDLRARVVGRWPLVYGAEVDCLQDRPPHVRAGSGMALVGGLLAIIQDDACFIALIDLAQRTVESVSEGAAARCALDLDVAVPPPPKGALETFDAWRVKLAQDQDLATDARMMVPVFHDLERQKTKVWVFLGWQTTFATVTYSQTPRLLEVQRVESPPATTRLAALRRKFFPKPEGPPPEVEFGGQHVMGATPVFAEVYVTELLDRDEFRRHCDQHQVASAILAGLK